MLALRTEGDARADMTALNDVLSTAVAPGSNLVIAALRCASRPKICVPCITLTLL